MLDELTITIKEDCISKNKANYFVNKYLRAIEKGYTKITFLADYKYYTLGVAIELMNIVDRLNNAGYDFSSNPFVILCCGEKYDNQYFTLEERQSTKLIEKKLNDYHSILAFRDNEGALDEYMDFTYKEFLKSQKIMQGYIESIKNSGLSPFEKYLMAYLYATDRPYIEEDESQNGIISRGLNAINNSNYQICAGFSFMLSTILNNVGIEAHTFSLIYDDDAHALDLVNIIDSKYKIKGMYFSDPTFDVRVSAYKKLTHSLIKMDDIDKFDDFKGAYQHIWDKKIHAFCDTVFSLLCKRPETDYESELCYATPESFKIIAKQYNLPYKKIKDLSKKNNDRVAKEINYNADIQYRYFKKNMAKTYPTIEDYEKALSNVYKYQNVPEEKIYATVDRVISDSINWSRYDVKKGSKNSFRKEYDELSKIYEDDDNFYDERYNNATRIKAHKKLKQMTDEDDNIKE